MTHIITNNPISFTFILIEFIIFTVKLKPILLLCNINKVNIFDDYEIFLKKFGFNCKY